MSTARERLLARAADSGYAAGWRAVRMLPEPVARAGFDRAGRWAAGRDGTGVRQLQVGKQAWPGSGQRTQLGG